MFPELSKLELLSLSVEAVPTKMGWYLFGYVEFGGEKSLWAQFHAARTAAGWCQWHT